MSNDLISIKAEEVEKIAHLARLAIDKDEIPLISEKLSNILHLVAEMDQVNTQGIEPMAHPFDAVQRLRPDVATSHNEREKLQACAPHVEAGLYLVPKVISENPKES